MSAAGPVESPNIAAGPESPYIEPVPKGDFGLSKKALSIPDLGRSMKGVLDRVIPETGCSWRAGVLALLHDVWLRL
jgi:hypothetical protein